MLSFLVVISHFWSSLLPGGDGSLAVMGFYVISGYVITLVWSKTYGNAPNGFKRFWLNRFVRLYPTFLASSVIGFLAIYFYPEAARAINRWMELPWSPEGLKRIAEAGIDPSYWWAILIPQITLVGYQAPAFWGVPITFSPNAWSVNMELYFYLAFSFGLTATFFRARRFFQAAFLVTSTYFLALCIAGHQLLSTDMMAPYIAINYHQIFYKTPVGIAFFFSLGALVYYFPKKAYPNVFKVSAFILLFAIPLVPVPTPIPVISRLLAFGILCAITLLLWPDTKPKGILKLLGDLSYPLFLLHWPVGVFVSGLTGLEKNSAAFFIFAMPASLSASVLAVYFLERPLEAHREKIRPKTET
ncbi:hypothetical protein SU32_01915 [Ahrensia marina]|uniref:Acyltransferase 3 domain-containing protein n=2 Tax=Ahrensia marina TaxID=1514904 RepID=A0A0M9GPC9_9HYPH|nr:hypothetical protein SU32_01915 [Ahrensia marina]